MNKLEKILELSKSRGFESLRDECMNSRCEECSVSVCFKIINNSCPINANIEQLLEEYVEPKKLTKREHGICEYFEDGWIVRHKHGDLYWHSSKPLKTVVNDNDNWRSGFSTVEVFNTLFPFIKWEDEEPYSIEEMLKWEVEE